MKKTKLPKPTEELKENSIGLSEVKGIVLQAKKALPTAKEIERRQLKKGYKWVTLGKTSKLIHPKKVKTHLEDGWKLNNKFHE